MPPFAPSFRLPEKLEDAPWLVSNAPFAPLLVTVPAPASELTVWLKPPRSSTLCAVTVVAELALNAPAVPAFSVAAAPAVPSPTLVTAVYELAAVSVSTSVLAEPEVPNTLTVPEPLIVATELLPETSKVGSPETAIGAVSATPCKPSEVPGFSVMPLVARVVPLARFSAPVCTVVAPEYASAPESVTVRVPAAMVTAPAPLIWLVSLTSVAGTPLPKPKSVP